jgi:hypothetical protein
MNTQNENKNELNIELTEEMAEGVYSNLSLVGHSAGEFVVDFIRIMPNVPKAKVKSRIILTPQHAKQLLMALSDNVQKYESVHGTIKGFEQPRVPFPVNIQKTKGQA